MQNSKVVFGDVGPEADTTVVITLSVPLTRHLMYKTTYTDS